MVNVKFYLLFLLLITSLILFCTSDTIPNSHSENTVTISPKVLWKTGNDFISPDSVDSLRFLVFSSEQKFNDTISATFPFNSHKAVLNVPSGSKLIMLVEGFNLEQKVLYRGSLVINDLTNNQLTIIASMVTPQSPADFICTALSSCNFRLSWKDNSSNETGFIIVRKILDTFWPVDTILSGQTAYLHTGVGYSDYHEYGVMSFNHSGTSDTITSIIISPIKGSTNSAPMFLQESAQLSGPVFLGQTIKINFEIIDPDCDPFQITACSLLTISNDTIIWTPENKYAGMNIKLWTAATDNLNASDTLFWNWGVMDTIRPEIILRAQDTIRLALNDRYTEPGATAYDNIDGDITDKIAINGSVFTTIDSSYTIAYSVKDQFGNQAVTKNRIVYVLTGSYPDKVSPVIYLIGKDTIIHQMGQPFVDPGVYALDNRDDSTSITNKIISTGQVNTQNAETYKLTYQVTDNANNSVERVRYVKVVIDTNSTGL